MIREFRRAVTDQIRGRISAPVYGYLPDDPEAAPCAAVGRPALRESGTAAVMTMELTVTLLGRRISDEDSQAELDVLADELVAALGGTRARRADGQFIRNAGVEPATVNVAGLEFPAYLVAVAGEAITC